MSFQLNLGFVFQHVVRAAQRGEIVVVGEPVESPRGEVVQVGFGRGSGTGRRDAGAVLPSQPFALRGGGPVTASVHVEIYAADRVGEDPPE